MYINITFALYGISILISIICLVFIGLIFVQKNDRSNKTYIAVRRFSIVVLLTGLLYFLFYYREIVHAQYELQLPFRLIDYTLYVMIFLCWLFVLKHMMETEKYNKIIYIGIAISAIRFVASIIATTFFMDVYYYIADTTICSIWTIAERIFTVLTFLVIFFLLCIYYLSNKQPFPKAICCCLHQPSVSLGSCSERHQYQTVFWKLWHFRLGHGNAGFNWCHHVSAKFGDLHFRVPRRLPPIILRVTKYRARRSPRWNC